jgi:hypothetical protein
MSELGNQQILKPLPGPGVQRNNEVNHFQFSMSEAASDFSSPAFRPDPRRTPLSTNWPPTVQVSRIT